MSTDQLHAIPNTNNQPIPRKNAPFLGDEIRSFNGTFQLLIEENDGNLVLYIDDPNTNPNSDQINAAIWSSQRPNQGASIAVMQDDGTSSCTTVSATPSLIPRPRETWRLYHHSR
jgi:hypothetical protein